MTSLISHANLLKLLDYDPETGVFKQKIFWWKRKPGDIVGGRTPQGYWYVGVGGKQYPAHRLAWFYVYGNWPIADIDHINRNRLDNRIANLREATRAENLRNTEIRNSNQSGVKGVSLRSLRNGRRPNKAWVASIMVNGKRKHLGHFFTVAEAAKARADAEKELGVGLV